MIVSAVKYLTRFTHLSLLAGSETQITIKLTRNPTNNRGARDVKAIGPSQIKQEVNGSRQKLIFQSVSRYQRTPKWGVTWRRKIKVLYVYLYSSLQNSNLKTAWQNPPEHVLKWMSRGYLNITVILNTGDQKTKLTGQISIKRTCNSKWQLIFFGTCGHYKRYFAKLILKVPCRSG